MTLSIIVIGLDAEAKMNEVDNIMLHLSGIESHDHTTTTNILNQMYQKA